jgi:hypothetical protein
MPITAGLASAWRSAWHDARFRRQAIATPVVLLVVLRAYGWVLRIVEVRPGVLLPDPVLELLAPRDLSSITFGLVYGVITVGVVRLAAHPRALVVGTQAYVLMTLLRMVALYLTPLDPPPGMIALRDPFAEHVTLGARPLLLGSHGDGLPVFLGRARKVATPCVRPGDAAGRRRGARAARALRRRRRRRSAGGLRGVPGGDMVES